MSIVMKNKKISDILDIIEKLLPNEANNFTDEIKENIKQAIQDHLHSLDVVTREEFDVQKEVLLQTRLKIEELEKKIKSN
tara:strand:- start:871 stop:1110 length:240 start_codon:yes stop_codon:yes gene_type:complete